MAKAKIKIFDDQENLAEHGDLEMVLHIKEGNQEVALIKKLYPKQWKEVDNETFDDTVLISRWQENGVNVGYEVSISGRVQVGKLIEYLVTEPFRPIPKGRL